MKKKKQNRPPKTAEERQQAAEGKKNAAEAKKQAETNAAVKFWSSILQQAGQEGLTIYELMKRRSEAKAAG